MSFEDSARSGPPSTPRQQLTRSELPAPGSILRNLFSPAKWFGKSPVRDEDEADEDADEDEDEDDKIGDEDEEMEERDDETSQQSQEDDEEESIGITHHRPAPDQERTPNTTKLCPTLPETPSTPALSPQNKSPNAVLATFFSNKGDAPLSEVELEGVKALLAKQSSGTSPQLQNSQPPSYATPARKPYQPIFTPSTYISTNRPATQARQGPRWTGYGPSTSASSPFRRAQARTGLTPARFSVVKPIPAPSPAKYELTSKLPANESPLLNGKRNLDDIAAPASKRLKNDSGEASTIQPNETGTQTAASILAILDDESSATIQESITKSPEVLKAMLNPYASAPSPRRSTPRAAKPPARHERKAAAHEIARSGAKERRTPYQPKKSSNLANSFTANDDDGSLFSPKNRLSQSATSSTSMTENKKLAGFAFATSKVNQPSVERETPTKNSSSLTSAFGSKASSKDMFSNASSLTAHSTKPVFSYGELNESSKSSLRSVSALNEKLRAGDIASQSPFRFSSVSDNATQHQEHGGFAMAEKVITSDPAAKDETIAISPSADRPGMDSTLDVDDHYAPINDEEAHQSNGGFVVSDSQVMSPVKSTLVANAPQAGNQVDSPDLVHTLRDGTSYISPLKSRPRSESSEANASSAPSGFVFVPTHSKSSSSFTFSNYKKPTSSSSSSVAGGFTFDPKKAPEANVAKQGKEISHATVTPTSVRARILALPEAALETFAFTVNSKGNSDDLSRRVLSADMIDYKFTCPTAPSTNGHISKGFDWTAAGLRKPETGWECTACLVRNAKGATQCVSCESERPGSNVGQQPKPSVAVNNGGGFNWAAAGMKKPESQWTCATCMVTNPLDKTACLSCESER